MQLETAKGSGRDRNGSSKSRGDGSESRGAGRPGAEKANASTSYGQCVELASAAGGVAMRDSKDPDGPILLYARAEFKAFLDGARNGDFDGIGQ
jgi:Domain of unknown function (DUF397)